MQTRLYIHNSFTRFLYDVLWDRFNFFFFFSYETIRASELQKDFSNFGKSREMRYCAVPDLTRDRGIPSSFAVFLLHVILHVIGLHRSVLHNNAAYKRLTLVFALKLPCIPVRPTWTITTARWFTPALRPSASRTKRWFSSFIVDSRRSVLLT